MRVRVQIMQMAYEAGSRRRRCPTHVTCRGVFGLGRRGDAKERCRSRSAREFAQQIRQAAQKRRYVDCLMRATRYDISPPTLFKIVALSSAAGSAVHYRSADDSA